MSDAQEQKLAALRAEMKPTPVKETELKAVESSGPIIKDSPFELTEQMIPVPTGFRILVALPQVDETYGGGIVKTEQAMVNEEFSTVIVRVMDMGPDCYKDKERFPSGPYCKIGDFVVLRAYSGTRFKHHGKELFRIVNDDSIEGVVQDPSGITRI